MLLLRVFIVLLIMAFTKVVSAQAKIATVSPLSYSLSQAILEGTRVEVDYLPPKRLPMSRIPSWLSKQQINKFAQYDAFVTLSSILPNFDFYNSLRQSNIRITRIDMATAMLPKGEKVALHSPKEYFWLNNNNLLLMLGVLKRDFSQMWPDEKAKIDQNYQALSSAIRKINLKVDALIQEYDIAFLTSQNARLLPLGASLSSDFVSLDEAKAMGLNFIQVSSKKQTDPSKKWQIDDFTRVNKLTLQSRLQRNVTNLKAVLEQ